HIAINPLFSRLLEDFIDNLWRAIITHNFMVFKFKFVELRKSGFNRTNSFYRSIFDGNVSCL
ncbi:MAG: hypothetical protein KH303_10315, partial [Firmicutes bacterium]|nr:hypothetical protein [Bacillota bacterium]